MSNRDVLEESVADMRDRQSNYEEDDWLNRLKAFVSSQGVSGEIIDVKRPSGGSSAASRIFSIKNSVNDESSVKRYVARLAPEKSFWKEFDIVEQFYIQQSLHGSGLPVPEAVWLDKEGTYLGQPGYVMVFDKGEAATAAYFTEGPLADIDTKKRFKLLHNMTTALADFHDKADPWAVESVSAKGRGDAWVEREINMWFDLVEYGCPELSQHYKPVRDWLVETMPKVNDPVLVHGDYQASNVLWKDEEISAILDFEVVRVGPRESDVAYQCNQDIISAEFFGGLDIELPSLEQRVQWYEDASGVTLTNMDYHFLRAVFQLSCGVASLARHVDQNLMEEPTPFMDYCNRRLLALLPKDIRRNSKIPVAKDNSTAS